MLRDTQHRPATSLRMLCEAAEALGISTTSCLENTGLSMDVLQQPNCRISINQEVTAIENIARISPLTVGLGVAVGKRLHVNAFGIWGFAILTSPTLRSAILTAIDYMKLSSLIVDMSLEVSPQTQTCKLVFDTHALPQATRCYALERHAFVAMTFIRELIQQPAFSEFRIETTHDNKEDNRTLSDVIGLDVIGQQAADALVLPLALMDEPLPRSDPLTLQYCLDQCQGLIEAMSTAMPLWSQKVHDVVIENIATEHKIAFVADKLLVTERTLRRRLSDEGTSFRELYTDIRLTIAHELLEVAGLNAETVSWRVGYAEPASFTRAFTKKFGKTPGDVRKEAQKTP